MGQDFQIPESATIRSSADGAFNWSQNYTWFCFVLSCKRKTWMNQVSQYEIDVYIKIIFIIFLVSVNTCHVMSFFATGDRMVFSIVLVKLVKLWGTHWMATSNVPLCWIVWRGHCKFGLFASRTRIALMLIWHWNRVRVSIGNSFFLRRIWRWSHSKLNGIQMMTFVWRSLRAQCRWLSMSSWTGVVHWYSRHCFRLLSILQVSDWRKLKTRLALLKAIVKSLPLSDVCRSHVGSGSCKGVWTEIASRHDWLIGWIGGVLAWKPGSVG